MFLKLSSEHLSLKSTLDMKMSLNMANFTLLLIIVLLIIVNSDKSEMKVSKNKSPFETYV